MKDNRPVRNQNTVSVCSDTIRMVPGLKQTGPRGGAENPGSVAREFSS